MRSRSDSTQPTPGERIRMTTPPSLGQHPVTPAEATTTPPKEAQPRPSSQPPGPLQVGPRYYPSSPHRADQHQDVPPSPGTCVPRYETVGRDGYHDASPECYSGSYRDGRQPDPGQKNSMIGAVSPE
uniref:DNA-directed RNA polymerase II subunit RPB1-like n=1 Tax=Oncorhynchus gorbuscha TaxID=8017 RepID=UPI001EAF6F7A|nr:DNA-directed RNA polymerase II subunit RPB1-like [Oncorhynchus gorbuscha]XP_046180905.1 DNA-directed RNA polymerase II subunit RPB1-like [Oncorhynchus gorbuscha]